MPSGLSHALGHTSGFARGHDLGRIQERGDGLGARHVGLPGIDLSSASAATLRATIPREVDRTLRSAQAGHACPDRTLRFGLRDLVTASAGQQEEHDREAKAV
jgi:hypothetical protein